MRCRLGVLVLLAAVIALPATTAHAARKKPKCAFAWVGDGRVCLKPGERCRAADKRNLRLAGFECRKRRLVRAGERALRGSEAILLQPDGYPSLKAALQAFDMSVANLPGVRRTPGLVGEAVDGTSAYRWMLHYYRRLTRAQRAVVNRAIFPRQGARAAARPSPALEAVVRQVKPRLEAHGLTFKHPTEVLVGGPDPDDVTTVPQWLPYGGKVAGNRCVTTFGEQAADDVFQQGPSILAHELSHCAEAELFSTMEQWNHTPQWVGEGFGHWVGATVGLEVAGSAKPADLAWVVWLRQPEVDLFHARYDAMGFWALLQHEGVDPWTRFPAVSRAGATPGKRNHEAAYAAAIAGAGDFARTWGTTLHTLAPSGKIWDLAGPGMPAIGAPMRTTVAEGTSYSQAVAPRGAWAVNLDIEPGAEVVKITPTSNMNGYFRPPGGTDRSLQNERFCTVPGGCVCDDGTDLELPQIQPGRALLGYAGAFGGGNVTVTGQSLDALCGDKATLAGIEVFGPVSVPSEMGYEHLPLIEKFNRVSCQTSGSGASRTLRATASIGSSTLTMVVRGFNGFTVNDDIYSFDLGDKSTYVEFEGAGGSFSTKNTAAVAEAGIFGGVIGTDLDRRRRVVGGAVILMFDRSGSRAVQVLGGTLCRRR